MLINIHAVLPSSQVNGPGKRMVVFFQGCRRRCPGCFNPETHSPAKKLEMTPEEIFSQYYREGIEGLTVSGGEPYEQAQGLKELLKAAKERGLTTVVYTGYALKELEIVKGAKDTFEYLDVLIDGRYVRSEPEVSTLARGSLNQKFHFLTDRYAIDDFIMPGKTEVTIGPDGTIVETGFSSIRFKKVK